MNHVRFNILADFLRTVLVSLMVGLIWSAAAMLVVLFLAHQAGADVMPLEKLEKLGNAKEGRLVFKTKGRSLAAPTFKTDVHIRITGIGPRYIPGTPYIFFRSLATSHMWLASWRGMNWELLSIRLPGQCL